MSRKAFISDHLLNMREHLQKNYEKFHQNEAISSIGDANCQPQKTQLIPAEAKAGETRVYLPGINKKSAYSPEDREKRELEGRILHDLSQTDCELELLKNKIAELKKFNTLLKELHQKLQSDSGQQDKNIRQYSSEYFLASGRWRAFSGSLTQFSDPRSNDISPFWRPGYLLVAGAVLLSTIIISLVLVGIF